MDTGTLESDPVGNVLPELVKDAFADPAMLRVRDRAAAHDVRALDDLDEGKKGLPEVFDSRLSMHRVLLGTSTKYGRHIKTRCVGSTSNLLKRKD